MHYSILDTQRLTIRYHVAGPGASRLGARKGSLMTKPIPIYLRGLELEKVKYLSLLIKTMYFGQITSQKYVGKPK